MLPASALPQAPASSQPRPWDRARDGLAEISERLADPTQRPALLWRMAWTPFRVWSDAPLPDLPRREPPPPAGGAIGLAGQAVVGGIDRVRRRLWVSHGAAAICRGVWLGLLFATLLMLLELAGGPVFDPRPALVVGGLLLAAGLVLAAFSRPSRSLTAHMLDRTFSLQERLTTALDDLGLGVPAAGERAPVVYLQMADAANAVAVLRSDRRLRPQIPVREVVLIVLVALLLTTLAFVRGLGGGLPALAVAHVPEFTPAIERPAPPEPSQAEIEAAANPPTVQEVLEQSDRSSRARRDLQTLAKALADHSVTRPAAEQMAGGDYAAASDQLREAAAQTGNLSAEASAGLSDDLQQASEAMEPQTNGLQEATQGAAAGLRQDAEAARGGMSDLAEAVEQAGSQVVPPSDLASQMRNAQQAQSQSGSPSSGEASSQPGALSSSSAQFSAASDPGRGADAQAATGAEPADQRGSQNAQPGPNPADEGAGPPESGGQPGQAGSPGEGGQQGAGQGQQGEVGQAGNQPAAMEGEGDAQTAREGGGAGTGESAQATEDGMGSASRTQASAGEAAANPEVSTGGEAEADPGALAGTNAQIALPASSGDQGVQTSADGGSALRGSGAGVTAGSGYAVQEEVGEAGPDSNRVPPEHRETVERYFSGGSGE